VLIICPASLRINWLRESKKWLVRNMSAVIVTGSSWPTGIEINIINYDILTRHTANLLSEEWDLVICDESHYLKNPAARRTIAVVGKDAKKGEEAVPGIKARRRLMLTGTPIPNRPIEGWPLFHWLAPDEFRSFFGYAKQFCAAHNTGYGWDFSGSSNLGALQDKLRSTIMIRRLKADVLKELPAKRR
jgi:SWI/SNF-related matrix-associated actin-dependent regulator 1 of chromatin subfamily A